MKLNIPIIGDENGQKGFSILEVIISISILSIGILAMARMQTVALRGTTVANRLTVDTVAAQDLIEQVISCKYSATSCVDIDGDGEPDDGLEDGDGDGAAGLDDDENGTADVFINNQKENYTLAMNVADNVPVNNTKTIRVIVKVQAPGGSKKTTYEFIKGQLTRP